MDESRSLQAALERARREQPAALPADFSSGVMGRLREDAAVSEWPAFNLCVSFSVGIAAVLTAVVVSLFSGTKESSSGPPPIAMFGRPAVSSPFVLP